MQRSLISDMVVEEWSRVTGPTQVAGVAVGVAAGVAADLARLGKGCPP